MWTARYTCLQRPMMRDTMTVNCKVKHVYVNVEGEIHMFATMMCITSDAERDDSEL